MKSRSTFATVLLVLFAAAVVHADHATDQSTARKIIEAAISAQGGEEQVARLLKPWRAKVKGQSRKMEISGEIFQQCLTQGGIATSSSVLGIPVNIVAVYNDGRAWQSINGAAREVTGKELEEMQDGGYRSRRVRFLLPLVREQGFKLSLLPETQVSKLPAVGIRVQSEGHRDVDLYFDKESGLLVKIESRLVEPGKPPLVLEQICSEYRDFDGVKLATRFTKYENGKQYSVEEITDLTFVDRIDPAELAMPKN